MVSVSSNALRDVHTVLHFEAGHVHALHVVALGDVEGLGRLRGRFADRVRTEGFARRDLQQGGGKLKVRPSKRTPALNLRKGTRFQDGYHEMDYRIVFRQIC